MMRIARILLLTVAIVSLGSASPWLARSEDILTASEKVVFAVEKMTCALCPITVRTAMSGVDGVTTVEIDFEAKTATVTFDPGLTSPDAIAQASLDAGYPASPIGG